MRHYDDIGLLVPDRDPVSGYRVYRREHVLRLQRILLLRALGLSLSAIAEVLAGQVDDAVALRGHLTDLRHERHRIDRLIATVRRTLDDLASAPALDVDALFDGFEQRRERFEERLVARFGEGVRAAFRQAEQDTATWDVEQARAVAAEGQRLLEQFAELRRAGVSPDDSRVAPLVAEHRTAIAQFWDADDHAYRALADLLVDDLGQRSFVEAVDRDLPPWLRDAIHAHTC